MTAWRSPVTLTPPLSEKTGPPPRDRTPHTATVAERTSAARAASEPRAPLSILELAQCRVARPLNDYHLVAPTTGRALCGIRVTKVLADAGAGWEAWRNWPGFRCRACEQHAGGRTQK